MMSETEEKVEEQRFDVIELTYTPIGEESVTIKVEVLPDFFGKGEVIQQQMILSMFKRVRKALVGE